MIYAITLCCLYGVFRTGGTLEALRCNMGLARKTWVGDSTFTERTSPIVKRAMIQHSHLRFTIKPRSPQKRILLLFVVSSVLPRLLNC
ncbi:unnamed protein product, partial [Sphacelaria rigidula]